MYEPVPISDFCHVKYENSDAIQNLNTENNLMKLLEACPDSELVKSLNLANETQPDFEHFEKDHESFVVSSDPESAKEHQKTKVHSKETESPER